MFKSKYLITFILLSVTIVNCNILQPKHKKEADVLMPLAIGNSWTYSDNNIGTYTITIVDKKSINGKDYYLAVDDAYQDTTLLKNESNGLSFVDKYDDNYYEYVFLRYPFDKTLNYSQTNDLGGSVSYNAYKEKVDVPAGTFDCFIYEYKSDEYKLPNGGYESVSGNLAFAPGVGIVGDSDGNSKLISYDLK